VDTANSMHYRVDKHVAIRF